MRGGAADLAARDANVLVVTTGTPSHTAEFCRDHRVPFTCLAARVGEPGYQAFGLKKAPLRELFGPSLLAGVLTALRRWREVRNPKSGDVYQMSGTFVIDRHGTLQLAHRDEHPNDHASLQDVLDCLDGLLG